MQRQAVLAAAKRYAKYLTESFKDDLCRTAKKIQEVSRETIKKSK